MSASMKIKQIVRPLIPDRLMVRFRLAQHSRQVRTNIDAVLTDLELHLGVAFEPLEVRITRWPGAFAQYRPHHARWVDAVEQTLAPGVFITGAGYRGIGIPACVRSGAAIAGRACTHLANLEE